MICAVKTPTHLLIRRTLREYSLPPSIRQYALEHLTEKVIKATLMIEDISEEHFSFLKDITRDWISSPVYEQKQFGTRSARLYIFSANSVLFEKDSCTVNIKEFIRTLEDVIRNKTFSSVGLVARTIWHTKPNEHLNGTPDELAKTELGRTIRIGIYTLPKYTEGKTADEILSNLLMDFWVLHRLSKQFQEYFVAKIKPLTQLVGKEFFRYEEIIGKKLDKELRLGIIQITPEQVHKDVRMFSVNEKGVACANIMKHNEEITMQSFTASENALVSLLARASDTLKTENERISKTIL